MALSSAGNSPKIKVYRDKFVLARLMQPLLKCSLLLLSLTLLMSLEILEEYLHHSVLSYTMVPSSCGAECNNITITPLYSHLFITFKV